MFDIKTVIGENGQLGRNNIKNKLQDGNSQGAENVTLYFPNAELYDETFVLQSIRRYKEVLKKDRKEHLIAEMWVLVKGEIKKFRL
ncbi:MAG: hypothetical protein EAS48_00725 [Chryseobacterium sp.]|nr:MAG: hypothetical protein EAS48_00725 [Chryseobacterium sp.]